MRKKLETVDFQFLKVDAILDNYMKHPKFRGIRNILEGEPDDWLGRESVQRGLGMSMVIQYP